SQRQPLRGQPRARRPFAFPADLVLPTGAASLGFLSLRCRRGGAVVKYLDRNPEGSCQLKRRRKQRLALALFVVANSTQPATAGVGQALLRQARLFSRRLELFRETHLATSRVRGGRHDLVQQATSVELLAETGNVQVQFARLWIPKV